MKISNFKKIALGLGTIATVAAPVAATVSCGGDDDSTTLRVMMIPSQSPEAAQAAAAKLSAEFTKLENTAAYKNDGITKVEVTAAASYEAAAQALKAGAADMAYSSYGMLEANKGDIRYIMQSARKNIGWDLPTAKNAADITTATNGDITLASEESAKFGAAPLVDGGKTGDAASYDAIMKLANHAVTSKVQTKSPFRYTDIKNATWYRSQVMANKDSAIDKIIQNIKTGTADQITKAKADFYKNVKIYYTSKTSGASYLDVIKAIKRIPNFSDFKIENLKDNTNLIKSTGYEDSVTKLASGNGDLTKDYGLIGIFSGVEDQGTIASYNVFHVGVTKPTAEQMKVVDGSPSDALFNAFNASTTIETVSTAIVNDGISVATDTRLSNSQIKDIQEIYTEMFKDEALVPIIAPGHQVNFVPIAADDAINK